MTYGPGIHERVPFDTYREWPHLNGSALLWGQKSPEHLKAALDGEIEYDSPDLAFGRAMHCRLLEPDLFELHWSVAQPCCAEIKSGDRKGEPCGASSSISSGDGWYCKTHRKQAGEDAIETEDRISQEEADRIERICERLKAHQVVKLLRREGGFEASAIWENSGVTLKGRFDKLILHRDVPPTIIDLKKCGLGRGDKETFARDLLKYNYHVKAAMYHDAVKKLTGEAAHFIWIVVEDQPPHSIGVYECGVPTLDAGKNEFINLLQMYKACADSGVWPGYSLQNEPIDAPDWYLKRFAGSWA